jgi:hypothetical protein
MVARVRLGRVTGSVEVPRGPDVIHRVRVKPEWLEQGATIEIELPRNLSCAACKGGGCDKCQRSGAITLRSRSEPVELVTVTLPRAHRDMETTASGKSLVVRIPERGGLADSPDLPRGLLLLNISPADVADVIIVDAPAPPSAPEAPALPPERAPAARRVDPVVIIVAVLVMLLIAYLVWVRVSGRG